MIDENKEQLRNLFRKYNVVDVQPAVTDKLPDDITTLQVREAGQLKAAETLKKLCVVLRFQLLNTVLTRIFTAGYYHPGRAAVLGWNLFCHNELALPQSVRTFCVQKKKICSASVVLPAQAAS